jgi:hypothetical protein
MNAVKAEQGVYSSGHVISGRNVTIFDPHAVKPAVAHVHANDAPPAKSDQRVRLIRNGDVVTAIEIRCKCGEVIYLECEY